MPIIYITQPNGALKDVEATVGHSLLRVAQDNDIDGFWAECGGNCNCATCHCYIDPEQMALLKPASSDELALLEAAAEECKPNSRLACQVTITEACAGLRVQIAQHQI